MITRVLIATFTLSLLVSCASVTKEQSRNLASGVDQEQSEDLYTE